MWGVWLTPTSDHRLGLPWLVIAKVPVFGLAAVALAAAGHPRLAITLGVLAAVNLALAVVLGNPDPLDGCDVLRRYLGCPWPDFRRS